MNKSIIAMGTLIAASASGLSAQENATEPKIIEKPSVTVVDGKMTPEILEALGRVSEPVVSPDGKKVAFTLTYEDIQENKGNSEIYVMDIDGKNMTRLTRTAGSESNIAWLEGGAKIAYIGKNTKGDNRQIFVMNADGTGNQMISDVEGGVDCFLFAPDGKRVVYASQIKAYEYNSHLKDGLPKTTGRIVNDLMYKHWDEWVTTIPHPFVAEFDGTKLGEARDIMANQPYESPVKPFGGAESFAWTKDSKKVVYTSRKNTGKAYAFSTDSNLYLYDIEADKTENLTENTGDGYDTDPVVSPDGKYLAWLSMKTPKYESDQKRVMVLDLATRSMRNLTGEAGWDYSGEQLAWTPDSKSLYVVAAYQGTQPVFKVDLAKPAFKQVAVGLWDYVSVSALPKGKFLSMRHNMLRPNEICITDAKGKTTDITDINGELLSQIKPAKVEKRMIPTTDGKEMCTWVIYPPEFDPNKKYPALLYCQGGPQQAVSQFWSYRWNFQIMASNGYIIVAPNRRGLPGFGTEWNHQISKDYGGQNMKDYFSAIDTVSKEPYVDSEHLGAIGASYGGFSVYWLAGHHDNRFAALVAHAGIFNLEAQYLETEEMWFVDYDLGGAPWEENNAIAQRTYKNSPHLAVNKWTAPILVTVGELDYRILASQGMQAFNAAKMHGLEAEMLVFPDENHWILKPQNAVLWQRVFFNFLDTYLQPSSQVYKNRINARRR